jgi:poly(A) polymerase
MHDTRRKQGREWVQFMRDVGLFETREETLHRVDILMKLSEAVDKWIKLVAAHRGMSVADVEEARAVVNTFGSFRLEVHGPGASLRWQFTSHGPRAAKLVNISA